MKSSLLFVLLAVALAAGCALLLSMALRSALSGVGL